VHKEVGWGVYDIKIEGISMVSTYRTDFGASVDKNGIDGFLSDLKDRAAGRLEPEQDKS
jgi:phospholipid transport system substrate-binding protein